MSRFIRWVRNTRRATQRLGFCKPSVFLTETALARGEARDALRHVIERRFILPQATADGGLAQWLEGHREHSYYSVMPTGLAVQAQAFYLFRCPSRSGWLSPKGAEEFIEVLPRQFGLLDEVFRPTELGGMFRDLLVPPAEQESWDAPSTGANPLALNPGQRYFLAYAICDSDGDFLIPWMDALMTAFGQGVGFSLLDAGRIATAVLQQIADRFGPVAYLDEERRRLLGVSDAADGIDAELAEQGSQSQDPGPRGLNRLRHLAVPRLEWLVDLALLEKESPDGSQYGFTRLGKSVTTLLGQAYRDAIGSGFADRALQRVMDSNFAGALHDILWLSGAARGIASTPEVVEYLGPAYAAAADNRGYCLLRPLNVIAAIMSRADGLGSGMEYSDVLDAVEQAYRAQPERLHYTVDRLSSDVQIKLM